jgi:LmbE family N-acetylglucosaminyl deacetylase
MEKIKPEGWETSQKILVVLAHPDDPEFFCGATIARWTSLGHEVIYCLLTRGDKGARDGLTSPFELGTRREKEQKEAGKVLGVTKVRFLSFSDGALQPDMLIRKAVVRAIRQEKPTILLSSDPLNFFPSDVNINHPDHRLAGQIVAEAAFPACGNPLFFPDLLEEGLQPHSVKEVWFSLTAQPNTVIDVTAYWEMKIQALHKHDSQIADHDQMEKRIRSRHTQESTDEFPRYEERFRRITFG